MSQGPYNPYQSPWGSPGQPQRPSAAVASKVTGPAVGLMVAAGISGLLSLGLIGVGFFMMTFDPPQGMQRGPQGIDPEQQLAIMRAYGIGYMISGVVDIVVAIVIMLAGVKMKNMESYGLAMTGAILAIIPCVSSCCLVSTPIGIWAVVVLADQQVKKSFR